MKLAAWRLKNGKTQEWVAEQLGVTQPHVSNMERSRNPTIPGARVIIKAYEMSDGEIGAADWFEFPVLSSERAARAAQPTLPGMSATEAA